MDLSLSGKEPGAPPPLPVGFDDGAPLEQKYQIVIAGKRLGNPRAVLGGCLGLIICGLCFVLISGSSGSAIPGPPGPAGPSGPAGPPGPPGSPPALAASSPPANSGGTQSSSSQKCSRGFHLVQTYSLDSGKHCGGKSITDVSIKSYGWQPGEAGVAACKEECTRHPACTAFVFRDSDQGCFWKTNTTPSTKVSMAGHHCYSQTSARKCVKGAARTAPCRSNAVSAVAFHSNNQVAGGQAIRHYGRVAYITFPDRQQRVKTGHLRYPFICTAATTVSFRAKVVTKRDGKSDSLLVDVDMKEETVNKREGAWHTGQGGDLTSLRFIESRESKSFKVSKGRHDLYISEREDGISFSEFLIEKSQGTCRFAVECPLNSPCRDKTVPAVEGQDAGVAAGEAVKTMAGPVTYVTFPNDIRKRGKDIGGHGGDHGYLRYYFRCAAATTVSFVSKVIANSGHDDSLYIAVDMPIDSHAARGTWHTGQGGNMTTLSFIRSRESPAFKVKAGKHALYISEREDGITFSHFTVVKGSGTCNFVRSCQPTAQCRSKSISALAGQDAGVAGGEAIMNWAAKTPYVSFPQTTNGVRSGNEDDGYIRHDNIDCSVVYDNIILCAVHLCGTVVATSGTADSVHAAVNIHADATRAIGTWHTGQGGDLKNDQWYQSRPSPTFTAKAGDNNLFVSEREDGIKVASFIFEQGRADCNFKTQCSFERGIDKRTCHTAVKGDACYLHVSWAMKTGIKQHPQWYPGLTKSNTFENFQCHIVVTKSHKKECNLPPCDGHGNAIDCTGDKGVGGDGVG